MKPIIYSLTLMILIISCNNISTKPNVESGLVLEVVQIGGFSNFTNEYDSNYYYLFELNLINNTSSNYEFVTYSCQSMINIITDSEQLKPLAHNCSANYPITINLKPKHEFSVPVIFFSNRFNECNISEKFGFVVADPKQFPDIFDIKKQLYKLRESREDVIWSEVIEVSVVSFHPFILKNVVNDSTYSVERIY